ncbi:protein FAR1-RELATED SEQUENCE 5-like [Salvia divinorum]|uniref:Protein FAR1-RELATED SEQUENCE 5-like n=1 Tax=Salvia divinorum TaxID=28513 RepID=A0ABD1GLA6_SALDI
MYIPVCDEVLKPMIGMKFKSLVERVDFYEHYARLVGFGIRKQGYKLVHGIIKWQYLTCNRQSSKKFIPGHASKSSEVSAKKRRWQSFRCECLAKLNLSYFSDDMGSGYEVHHFVEYHNHLMVADEHRHFMTANRNLDPIHRRFMEDCGICNIGPTLTFKLLKEITGGAEQVGCDIIDIRNGYRDMMSNIDGSDAQMIVDYMRSKKESCDGFYYEFEIGSHGKLTKLFWADVISRQNYHMFGDVVSFDSTYNTNMYCMIFAPFTGKHNHSRPVTFGVGLLSNEKPDEFDKIWNDLMERYGLEDMHWWLKSSLLKAAHGLPSEEQQPFEYLDEKQEIKKKLYSNFYRLVQKSEGNVVSTKGSGIDRVSRRKTAIKKANKSLRRCGKCHELGHHDSRNCGTVNRNTGTASTSQA